MRSFRLVIFLAFAISAPPSLADAPVNIDDPGIDDPGAVTRELNARGRDAAFMHDWRWEKIYDHIETGNLRWLDVAKKIACCVDAGSAEALPVVISIALTHKPEAVLHKVQPGLSGSYPFALKDVCTVQLIEPSETEFYAHVREVKKALEEVKAPGLQAKKAECLKIISAETWLP
jgi:hypothetical protein